ncbi:MAG: hypothetical protein PVF05_06685 [Gemmatimonadales bacterium]|jgi:hypothetical protein
MHTFLRRLKGAAVNALFWGAVWFGIGFVVNAALQFAAGGLFLDGSLYLRPPFHAAIGSGLAGMTVGGLFSLFIATNFHHRDLDELSAWRFAGGGALVAMAVALGMFYFSGGEQMLDMAIADPAGFYQELLRGMMIVGGIGGATAFSTIKLAQRAPQERLEPTSVEVLGG